MPSYDTLVKKYLAEGLTESEANARIINRIPNTDITVKAFMLKTAGKALLVVDIGISGFHVYEAEGWDNKFKVAISETAKIAGAAAGARAGAKIGGSIGIRFGPWGGAIGGIGGAIGGGIAGGMAAQSLIDKLLYEFFPPNQLDIEFFIQ